MKMRFLVIDRHGQIRKAPRQLIESAWDSKADWEPRHPDRPTLLKSRWVFRDLRRVASGRAVRIITVILGRRGRLVAFYYLKISLNKYGYITEQTRRECVQEQMDFLKRTSSRKACHQLQRYWPRELFRQLAVALDVPLADVMNCLGGFGGPLLLATIMDWTFEEALLEFWEI